MKRILTRYKRWAPFRFPIQKCFEGSPWRSWTTRCCEVGSLTVTHFHWLSLTCQSSGMTCGCRAGKFRSHKHPHHTVDWNKVFLFIRDHPTLNNKPSDDYRDLKYVDHKISRSRRRRVTHIGFLEDSLMSCSGSLACKWIFSFSRICLTNNLSNGRYIAHKSSPKANIK